MNGRIYDPELGRMLSPDPFVQVPEYSQNFNRYSYVMNNPLNTTDPSGFSWLSKAFHRLGNWIRGNWRSIVSIVVVAVLTWGLGTFTALGAYSSGAISGGVSGGLNAGLNGGDFNDILRGTVVQGAQGAIAAGFLHPLGEAAGAAGTFSAETAIHVAGHGVLGGASNAALGGKFQDGFLSAAASTFAADAGLLGGEGGGAVGIASRTIRASIIGGSASALGGGKFANGAYTAAFQHLLNEEGPKFVSYVGGISRETLEVKKAAEFAGTVNDGVETIDKYGGYAESLAGALKGGLPMVLIGVRNTVLSELQIITNIGESLFKYYWGVGSMAMVAAGSYGVRANAYMDQAMDRNGAFINVRPVIGIIEYSQYHQGFFGGITWRTSTYLFVQPNGKLFPDITEARNYALKNNLTAKGF
jgi:hypothetical protein